MRSIVKKISKDRNFAEILRGSSTAFILRIIGLIFSYTFIFQISKTYGARALGIFALSLTLLQIFTVLGKLGADTAIMRFVSEFTTLQNRKAISRMSGLALSLIIPFSIILSLFLFFYSRQIADIVFRKSYLSGYFKIISVGIVPNVLLSFNSERLRGLKEIKFYSFFKNVSVPLFASIFMGITLLILKDNRIPVFVYLSSILITAVFSIYMWRRSFLGERRMDDVIRIDPGQSLASYGKLLKLSLPILFTNSLVLLMGWTDTVMIGIFHSTFEVGIYRVPLRLAAISSFTLVAANAILGPKITELWESGKRKEIKKLVRKSTALIFWTSFPLFLMLWVFRFPILGFFGTDFQAGAFALILLMIGQFVNSIVGSVGLLLIVTGKQLVIQNVMIIGTIANVTLNYFLIPRYGINGAAFASMISLMLINIIPFFLVKKYYGFYTLSLKNLVFKKDE